MWGQGYVCEGMYAWGGCLCEGMYVCGGRGMSVRACMWGRQCLCKGMYACVCKGYVYVCVYEGCLYKGMYIYGGVPRKPEEGTRNPGAVVPS